MESRMRLEVKIPPKSVTDRCMKCPALTECCTHGVRNLATTLPAQIATLRTRLAAVKRCHRRGDGKKGAKQ